MSEQSKLHVWLAGVWLVFTVSLAGWWLIFGLNQLEHIRQLNIDEVALLERKQRMLLAEGAILILSVLAGGGTILRFVHKERSRHRQIRDFFTAFTHDTKTALASLRLQAESIEEDHRQRGGKDPLMTRLVQDTVRLQLQLENSLFLANLEKGKLHLEPVALSRVVESLHHHWPDLEVILEKDVKVRGDVRALESVFGNLFQNAIVHGNATRVRVSVSSESDRRHLICVEDNGTGFSGDLDRLGELFLRPGTTSGTGIGLYLCSQLLSRMGGKIRYEKGPGQGLRVLIELMGAS